MCVIVCGGGGAGGRRYRRSTLTLKNLLRDTLQKSRKAVKKLKCTYQLLVCSVGSCAYQHLVHGDPRPFNKNGPVNNGSIDM